MQKANVVNDKEVGCAEHILPGGFKDGARWAAEEAAPKQLLQLEAVTQVRLDYFRAKGSSLPFTPCERFHDLIDPESLDGDAESFWGGVDHDSRYIEDFAKGAVWHFDRNRRKYFPE